MDRAASDALRAFRRSAPLFNRSALVASCSAAVIAAYSCIKRNLFRKPCHLQHTPKRSIGPVRSDSEPSVRLWRGALCVPTGSPMRYPASAGIRVPGREPTDLVGVSGSTGTPRMNGRRFGRRGRSGSGHNGKVGSMKVLGRIAMREATER